MVKINVYIYDKIMTENHKKEKMEIKENFTLISI